MPENTTHHQPTELTEILSKATSTHELPESMLTKGEGLSDEKTILLIMRYLEDFSVPSPGSK
jgi:hypothetical protein